MILVSDASTVLGNPGLTQGRRCVRYLGPSYETLLRLKAAAPEGLGVHGGEEDLKIIARRIENDIINLGDFLWPHPDKSLWNASDIAEHGTVTIPIQRMMAMALLLIELVNTQKADVFISETRAEALALYECACRAGISAQLSPARLPFEGTYQTVSSVARGLRKSIGVVVHLLRHKRIASLLRKRHNKPRPSLKDVDVVLFNWGTPKTFNGNAPSATIPDLGRLPGIINQLDLTRAFVCSDPGGDTPHEDIAENIISAPELAIMIDECVSVFSAIRGVVRTFLFPCLVKHSLVLDGQDLSPIMHLALKTELATGRITQALLRSAVAKGLKKMGANPQTFICVYENQPWEKVLRSGLRAEFPQAQQIGAVFVQFAENHLSLYPSGDEIRENRIPDKLIVGSSIARDLFIARGLPRESVIVGGSLRLEHLLDAHLNRHEKTASSRSILCCGNTWFDTTLELVLKSVLATRDVEGVRLVVNMHPRVGKEFVQAIRDRVDQQTGGDISHVIFSDQRADALLESVDLVLYGQSGSVFDALAHGLPVIYVSNETDLDYDKLPQDAAILRPKTVEDLRSSIKAWVEGPSAETLSHNKWEELLQRTIFPVDIDVWREILVLNETSQ